MTALVFEPRPPARPRMAKTAALRYARLGLLAADHDARTNPDPVARADAATAKADWHVALTAIRAPTKRGRRRA